MWLHVRFALILLSCFASSMAERSVYIVHMDKSSMPKAFSSHHYWYSSMLKSVKSVTQITSNLDSNKPEPKLIYTYDNAFHGFSAQMSQDELQALKNSPGFISAYPDVAVMPDTTRSTSFLGLSSATGLWPASQYGKDIIIGVVDSGIWPESPSFRDDGMTEVPPRWKGVCQGGEQFNSSLCNRKIIGARYYNAGFRAAIPDREIPDSARDDDGHGTHIAAIAAGNFVDGVSFIGYAPGTARGVAPRARLSIYKAVWFGGVGSDILAGIDQAVADGVDIISVSLGVSEINLYENPLSIASFGARQKGIVVCFSAGNRGPSVRTIRSGFPWAVIVAAGTIDRWFAGTLTLGNGKTITGWTTFPGRAVVRNEQLVYNETLSACNSSELVAQAPFGSVIVCDIRTIFDLEYSPNFLSLTESYLPRSDARAAIIISDEPQIYRSSSFSYPGVVITPAQAQEVVSYASNSSEPRVSIEFQQTVLGTHPRAAPALSDRSSKGPARSYERILKPDLMAPGVLILSAYNPGATAATIGNNIVLSSDYTLVSGTSVACPHVAGVAALLKAAHPEWSPSAIQSAMMTTAYTLDNTKQPIKELDGFDTSPLGIGSGHVDPNRALDPGLVYDASPQDFVNLVCSMNFTREQTQTITRSNNNCSTPSSDLNYPSFVALITPADIGRTLTRRFKRTLTNVGRGAATYRVRVEVPVNATIRIQPQTLMFRKKYEKQSYSLTVRYRGDIETQHKPGSITWVDDNGNHTVRSPIMISAAAEFFG